MPKQTQTTAAPTNTRPPAGARPAPGRAAPAAEPLVQRALADPAALSAQEVAQLQRQFGNQAVTGLLKRGAGQRAALPQEAETLQRRALPRKPNRLSVSVTKTAAIQRAGEGRRRSNSAPPSFSPQPGPGLGPTPPSGSLGPQPEDQVPSSPTTLDVQDNGPVGDDSLDSDDTLLSVGDQVDDDNDGPEDDDTDTTTTTTTSPTGGGQVSESGQTPPTVSPTPSLTPGPEVVIPPYPSALSENEWRRNRGLKAKLGRDDVGIQLGLVSSAHRGVLWMRFDVNRTPPQASDTFRAARDASAKGKTATDKATDAAGLSDAKEAAREALDTAKAAGKETEASLNLARNEFRRNVVVLLGQAGMLRNLLTAQAAKSPAPHLTAMLAALTPYINQLQSLEKAFVWYEQALSAARGLETTAQEWLAALAKQEAAEDETGLTGELDGLETGEDEEETEKQGRQRRLMREIVGPKFYSELDLVRFYKEPDTMQWLQSADVTISAKDNTTRNTTLTNLQTKGKLNLLTYKDKTQALKAMRDQTQTPALAAKQIVTVWASAFNAYNERTGFVGIHRQWKRQQLSLAGSQSKYAAWEEKFTKAAALTDRLGEVLLEDQDHITSLAGEVAGLSRSTGARPRRGSVSF
ncbi:MAG: hypothetical protein IT317_00705 [Anaerolineales bacterium]|nr:hypothetical protein [Anaerolineales bacterium]